MKENEIKINSNRKHIVLDCDECLALISPKWFKLIMEKRDYFDKYFYLPKEFDYEKEYFKVYERKTFFLNEWLFKYKENFSEEEVVQVCLNMFALYDTKDFYDDIVPNKMSQAFTFLATQNSLVNKITVVTRSTDHNRESKEDYIYKTFSNNIDKLDIIHVEREQNKSDIIKELKDVALILEDEISNIEDIVENCNNIEYTDFYIPKYGYNKNIEKNEKIKKFSDEKNIRFNYYHLY